MPVLPTHEKMRRRIIEPNGDLGLYLHSDRSELLAGTWWRQEQVCQPGTSGYSIEGVFTTPQIGTVVENVTQDFTAIITGTGATTLTVQPPLSTVDMNWGAATATEAGKLVDSAANFTETITPGMVACSRDLTQQAIVVSVDSDTELTLSADIFASGDPYSILKGFMPGDNIRLGTTVVDGSAGHIMVEIPLFYFAYHFDAGKHKWRYSEKEKAGLEPMRAFIKPDGSLYQNIYVGAFEGGIDIRDFTANYLTDYNLSTAKLLSAAGLRPTVYGQRSEFRTVCENNGAGFHQMDWYGRWVWQLLYMLEYEDMDSQTALGRGCTYWSGNDRDNWVADTKNRSMSLTGYSLRNGGNSFSLYQSNNPTSYVSYRGIENPWGNIFKWIDGININDNVPYLSNDITGFTDNVTTGYEAPGLLLPDSDGYIKQIHQFGHGLLISDRAGSSSTYIPDYYYRSAGWRVAAGSLNSTDGAYAGFAALRANYSAPIRSTVFGARVCFKK